MQFFVVLSQVVLQYMLAGLVLPDFFGHDPVDLRTSFIAHRRWFFGIGILATLASLAKDVALDGRLAESLNPGWHLLNMAAAGVAARTSQERYQKALPLVMAIGLAAYIGVLFARLG